MLSKVREIDFANNRQKAEYMQESAEQDARTPEIIETAERFRGIVNPWERARAILRFCQYCLEYIRDPGPGIEVLDSSEVGLWRGFGDCDLKARACVALMLASGLQAEIEPIFKDGGFPHVRARVRLDGRWWSLDPSIINSDIGQIPTRGIMTSYRGR